jgi:Rieske Fe-S protein
MNSAKEQRITRQDFLKLAQRGLVFTGLAAVVGPALVYFFPKKLEEMPSEPVLVCKEAELPVGASKTIKFGRYPALIIHMPDGLVAYSAVCTHFACIVKWDEALNQIVCPCHEGYFSPQDGSVLAGPPPTPLAMLSVNIVNGEIYVGPQSAGGEA